MDSEAHSEDGDRMIKSNDGIINRRSNSPVFCLSRRTENQREAHRSKAFSRDKSGSKKRR